MHDVAKPFQMKLISSLENDKEKYFCVNKYKDFFYRFANRNCFSMSMRKKKKWLRDLRNLNLVSEIERPKGLELIYSDTPDDGWLVAHS